MKADGLLQCLHAPTTGHIKSQMNPFHNLTHYFSNVYFNIILPSTIFQVVSLLQISQLKF
jgi:hypothetical protein